METERDADRSNEGRRCRGKKGRSAPPGFTEDGMKGGPQRLLSRAPHKHVFYFSYLSSTSDGADISADEEAAECPTFKRPLENVATRSGCEVTLKCLVTGSPPPTGRSHTFHRKSLSSHRKSVWEQKHFTRKIKRAKRNLYKFVGQTRL